MAVLKGQLNKFKALLTEKQAELSGGLRNRDEIAIDLVLNRSSPAILGPVIGN